MRIGRLPRPSIARPPVDGKYNDNLHRRSGEEGDRAVNKNSKDKKNNPVFAVIVAVVILLMSAGGAGIIIPLLIIGVMAYVIYTLSKQANQKSGETSSAQAEKSAFSAESFDPKKLAKDAKRSFSKMLTQEMKKDDLDDCDGGHEHVEPSYNMPADEKRREQLKSMLQNGLIEKEEYKILLKKYGL